MTGQKESTLKYILFFLLGVAFLATGGILVKLSNLPPISTGFYRLLLSIPILYPFAKKELNKLEKKDIFLILFAGSFFAMDLVFWNISLHMTTVANSNLLANMVPFTIIPISYFVYKKKLPKFFLIGLIITLVGVTVLVSGKFSPSLKSFEGDAFAFVASIFYSLFLLRVSEARKRVSALTIMFIAGIGGSITFFIVMLPFEGIHYPKTVYEFAPLIATALVSQVFGQGILSYCAGKLDVLLSSALVLTQPVIAAIYSYFIFKENLTLQEIIGIVIVLAGIFFAKRGFEG